MGQRAAAGADGRPREAAGDSGGQRTTMGGSGGERDIAGKQPGRTGDDRRQWEATGGSGRRRPTAWMPHLSMIFITNRYTCDGRQRRTTGHNRTSAYKQYSDADAGRAASGHNDLTGRQRASTGGSGEHRATSRTLNTNHQTCGSPGDDGRPLWRSREAARDSGGP